MAQSLLEKPSLPRRQPEIHRHTHTDPPKRDLDDAASLFATVFLTPGCDHFRFLRYSRKQSSPHSRTLLSLPLSLHFPPGVAKNDVGVPPPPPLSFLLPASLSLL